MIDLLEETKNKIPTFSSEKLCQIIVCYRYLNSYKELATLCMQELGKRRENGDNFDYESYIEKSLLELPEINLQPVDIRSLMSNIRLGKFR
jgi:hypothetical protein